MEELSGFLQSYELATNSHDFDQVRSLIADEAVYWFSNGSHEGIDAIQKAFEATWGKILNEKYLLKNVRWICHSDDFAVCIYDFQWSGEVDGQKGKGSGRGTNVLRKTGNKWQMIHEHLSNAS